MSKPVLGYWAIRGYAEQIRLLLRYLGVDFEDKQYEFGPAPDFSGESWYSEKFNLGLDFPNVPYWINGDVKLTESKAILKYVASVYGGKELVPEGVLEAALAEVVIGAAADLQKTLVNFAYGRKSPTIDKPIDEAAAKPLEVLAKYLGNKEWALGDKITYVDFFLYEVLKQYAKFNADLLKAQPVLEAYIRKFEELPQLKEYILSIESLPCYSPFALQF